MTQLTIDQVRKKLTETGFPVDEVIQKFWRIDSYGTILTNQLILDKLIEFLSSHKSNNQFTKFDFYTYFFNKITSENINLRSKLQNLSLVLETKQKNELPKSEMQSILSEVGLTRDELLSLGLFVENDTSVGFFHHTLSEFLVAEKWIIEESVSVNLDNLLVKNNGEIFAINYSWYGVIRFILDSQDWEIVYRWMMKIASLAPSIIDEGFSETISCLDPDRLTEDEKSKLFSSIFDTYRSKQIWIPLWTSDVLPNFCQSDNYQYLKSLIMEIDEAKSENLVLLGNILDIVGRLLIYNSVVVTDDKVWWRDKLINYANIDDENGVVQRRALSALSSYKADISLVTKVGKCLKHKSSLVREAYLDFCSDIDPNSEVVITKMVEGMKAGEDIYSRHGLYKITNIKGAKILLQKLATDDDFLKVFLDKENIFNNRDRVGDQPIIDNVKKIIDPNSLIIIKLIIKKSFETNDIYNQERSYFLKQLVLICEEKSKNYLDKVTDYLVNNHDDKTRFVYDYIPLFAWLLNSKNVGRFYTKLKANEQSGRFAQQAIYRARFEGEKGIGAYEKAISLNIVTRVEAEKDWATEQNDKIFKEFKRLLGSEKKKIYFPAVFQYFCQNEKVIRSMWKPIQKNRLIKLTTEEGLNKIDPQNFQLKISRGDDGKRLNQYNISSVAQYFGDVIRTSLLLNIYIDTSVRQKIINYIPFAYSDDWQTIVDALDVVIDSEMSWVNGRYLIKSDIKYFLPDSYIYFVKSAHEKGCELKTPVTVLKSIIDDQGINESDRRYAMETLSLYIGNSDIEIFDWLHSDFGDKPTQKTADDLLISVFKDRPTIEKRIQEIKDFATKAKGFEMDMGPGAHEVGGVEDELMEMHLAKPLVKLGGIEYKKYFFELLDFSAELLKTDHKSYWQYVNYLWKIVFIYFEECHITNLSLIRDLNSWILKNSYVNDVNWIRPKVDGLEKIIVSNSIKFREVEK